MGEFLSAIGAVAAFLVFCAVIGSVVLAVLSKLLSVSPPPKEGPAKTTTCIICGDDAMKNDYFCTRHGNYGGEG